MIHQLPTELVDIVSQYLDKKDIKAFRQANQRLNQIVCGKLWKNLVVICGLNTLDDYRAQDYVPQKIFDKRNTLVIDSNNVTAFTTDIPYMPDMMALIRSLTLVKFSVPTAKADLLQKSKGPPSMKQEKASIAWLIQSLYQYLPNVSSVKIHCEPIESTILNRFGATFPQTKWKYTLLPFREYLDEVPTAHTISVFWSAETAPLTASFVSDALTKVYFRQDNGVTSAPYDVAKLKETFKGCANLVKLVLQVHLVDNYATTDWIPQSVKDLHLLGKYESRTTFDASHVENLLVTPSSRDAAMNIRYADNTYVDCV